MPLTPKLHVAPDWRTPRQPTIPLAVKRARQVRFTTKTEIEFALMPAAQDEMRPDMEDSWSCARSTTCHCASAKLARTTSGSASDCVALVETNHVGWGRWSHKTANPGSGTLAVTRPDKFKLVVDDWSQGRQVPIQKQHGAGTDSGEHRGPLSRPIRQRWNARILI